MSEALRNGALVVGILSIPVIFGATMGGGVAVRNIEQGHAVPMNADVAHFLLTAGGVITVVAIVGGLALFLYKTR